MPAVSNLSAAKFRCPCVLSSLPQGHEVRGIDGQQYQHGTVSMSARASLARAYTRSSGGVSALSSRLSSLPATSTNTSVSVARLNATRRWSMPVLVFAESRDVRVAIGSVVSRSSNPAAGGASGDDRVTAPAAAKALTRARNWVNFTGQSHRHDDLPVDQLDDGAALVSCRDRIRLMRDPRNCPPRSSRWARRRSVGRRRH